MTVRAIPTRSSPRGSRRGPTGSPRPRAAPIAVDHPNDPSDAAPRSGCRGGSDSMNGMLDSPSRWWPSWPSLSAPASTCSDRRGHTSARPPVMATPSAPPAPTAASSDVRNRRPPADALDRAVHVRAIRLLDPLPGRIGRSGRQIRRRSGFDACHRAGRPDRCRMSTPLSDRDATVDLHAATFAVGMTMQTWADGESGRRRPPRSTDGSACR